MKLENLIFLREEKEWSQQDIAKILNVSQANYSRWENGTLLIPLKHLNTLANIFSSSMDFIIGLSNKNTQTQKIDTIKKEVVSKNLKEIRLENNLSIREFAKTINASKSAINDYELGKNLIIISFAYDICKHFNISLDYLCGRTDIKSRL